MIQSQVKTVLRKTGGLPRFSIDVRQSRVAKGFTMKTVADKAGLTVPHISQLESGAVTNPGMNSFLKVCTVLDLNPMDYGVTEATP